MFAHRHLCFLRELPGAYSSSDQSEMEIDHTLEASERLSKERRSPTSIDGLHTRSERL